MNKKKSDFDKVFSAWDILVIAFGAMIGWGWVVSTGGWIEKGGVVGAALGFAIGGVMYLLHAAWGFGSEAIPAPQASLMKMVVEGVMGGTLLWTLVLIGVFAAVIVEILGIPVMAFAVGLYLPI